MALCLASATLATRTPVANGATNRIFLPISLRASLLDPPPPFKLLTGADVSIVDRSNITLWTTQGIDFLDSQLSVKVPDLEVFAYNGLEEIVDAQMRKLGIPASQRQAKIDEWRDGQGQSGIRSFFIYTGGRLWRTNPDWNLMTTVPHELFHTAQFELARGYLGAWTGLGRGGPIWLTEGTAHYFGYRSAFLGDPARYRSLREFFVAGQLTSPTNLRLLAPAEGFWGGPNPDPYSLAMLAAECLVRTTAGGFASLTRFYSSLGAGRLWADAFSAAFGDSVDDFYRQFDSHQSSGFPPFD